jgi:hypothetical protein
MRLVRESSDPNDHHLRSVQSTCAKLLTTPKRDDVPSALWNEYPSIHGYLVRVFLELRENPRGATGSDDTAPAVAQLAFIDHLRKVVPTEAAKGGSNG